MPEPLKEYGKVPGNDRLIGSSMLRCKLGVMLEIHRRCHLVFHLTYGSRDDLPTPLAMLLFCPCGEDVCFLWIMVANHAVKVSLLDGVVESVDTFKGGHIGEQEAVWADANYGTVLFMEPLVHNM